MKSYAVKGSSVCEGFIDKPFTAAARVITGFVKGVKGVKGFPRGHVRARTLHLHAHIHENKREKNNSSRDRTPFTPFTPFTKLEIARDAAVKGTFLSPSHPSQSVLATSKASPCRIQRSFCTARSNHHGGFAWVGQESKVLPRHWPREYKKAPGFFRRELAGMASRVPLLLVGLRREGRVIGGLRP